MATPSVVRNESQQGWTTAEAESPHLRLVDCLGYGAAFLPYVEHSALLVEL
jgi:hypothetical protein